MKFFMSTSLALNVGTISGVCLVPCFLSVKSGQGWSAWLDLLFITGFTFVFALFCFGGLVGSILGLFWGLNKQNRSKYFQCNQIYARPLGLAFFIGLLVGVGALFLSGKVAWEAFWILGIPLLTGFSVHLAFICLLSNKGEA